MRNKKPILIAAIVVILAAVAFVCYECFIVKRGWVKTDVGTYYYDDMGKAYSGLCNMPDGTMRYFDPATNLMVIGEAQVEGNKYLFDSEGVMQFGLQKSEGSARFYDPVTGIMQTGWVDYEGSKLYFNEETGEEAFGLTAIGGLQYYFDTETGLMKTGDMEINGDKYSFDTTTGAGLDGFFTTDGVKRAYIGGKMLVGVRAYADNHLYYFGDDGAVTREIDGNKPMVSLTYDDGPSVYTDSIIDTFEQYGAKCTFFIVGDRISWNEDQARREAELGYEQGNHTYSHNRLTDLDADGMQEKLKGTDDELIRICGEPSTCLRPPEGKWNDTLKTVCNCPIILWSVDSRDWDSKNADKICDRVIGKVQDGDIVLMHDLYKSTAEATKRIVPALIEDGFQLVTVEEMGLLKTGGVGLEPGVVYYSIPNR